MPTAAALAETLFAGIVPPPTLEEIALGPQAHDRRVMDAARDEVRVDTLPAAIADAEWELGVLKALTEIGMDLARSLRDKVTGADAKAAEVVDDYGAGRFPPEPVPAAPGRFDPAAGFARISRAVRLTVHQFRRARLGLDSLRAESAQIEAKRAAARARHDAEETARLERAARNTIAAVIERAIDTENFIEEESAELRLALEERLDHDPAYRKAPSRDFTEVVEALCKDLDIDPDWDKIMGDDLANLGARPFRPCWSVFNKPSRRRHYPDGFDEPADGVPDGVPGAGSILGWGAG